MKSSVLTKFTFLFLLFANSSVADPFNMTAKCAATFDTFSKAQIDNVSLADHYRKLANLSWDMMVIYAEIDGNKVYSNGQIKKIITDHNHELSSISRDGSGYLPYLRSCSGWTNRLGLLFSKGLGNMKLREELAKDLNKPSLALEYPFHSWDEIKSLFLNSYPMQ